MERKIKLKWIYFVIINIFVFLLCWYDKVLSKKKKYRIAELYFFLFSALGGAIGMWVSMYLFHHKTKKWYFVYGISILVIFSIFLIIGR